MAVPPSYSDLGKAAKDIFSKGYGEFLVRAGPLSLKIFQPALLKYIYHCCLSEIHQALVS